MTIRLEVHGPVGYLLIDRPLKRNALTTAMFAAIPGLAAAADADARVRVLVVQSARPTLFSAGADIAELSANAHDVAWRSANQSAIDAAQHALVALTKPSVAFVDGDCIGGGCGLALACDLRIATTRARFGITPARLGLVYPLHDTRLLVDAVGPGQAKRILFTATLIDAHEAARIGLVDVVADAPDAIVDAIASNSVASTTGIKAIVRRILAGQRDDDDATRAAFTDAFGAPDFAEGVAAFLAKREPAFD